MYTQFPAIKNNLSAGADVALVPKILWLTQLVWDFLTV